MSGAVSPDPRRGGHAAAWPRAVSTEVLRAAGHLTAAVAELTATQRETPEGVELVDMAHDVDRLWRQLDEMAP